MSPLLIRLLVVAAILAAATLGAWWWRRREGRVTSGGGRLEPAQLRELGLEPDGARALGVLFSAPTCRPCEAAREVLGQIAAEHNRFRWTAVDAGEHLALAQRQRVRRVPTLLVVEPDGRVLARAGGVPRKSELLAALDSRGGCGGGVC